MKTNLQIKLVFAGLIISFLIPVNSSAQGTWNKYPDNPVLSGATWTNSAACPVVFFEDSVFKMWFGGVDSNFVNAIGYAESPDGINWDPNDDPVIPAGEPGSWDQWRNPGSVLRINDTLKMWYSGSSDDFSYEISIGYAWSLDNIVWNVLPDKVLDHGEPGTWDETGVITPGVYYDGSVYHMWYSGFEGSTMWDPMQEGYATSLDGINWVKDTINNPVITLGVPGSFFDTWIMGGSVLFLEDTYYIWFAGWDGHSTSPWKYITIGHATSLNGIDWTIQNDSLPVIDHGEPGDWDSRFARFCSVLIHEGQFKMWYDGRGSVDQIGYAEDGFVGLSDNNPLELTQTRVYPNPVSSEARIEYNLLGQGYVNLSVYNYCGEKMDVLVSETQRKGKHLVTWNADSKPAGVYLYRLTAGKQLATGKLVVVR